jgi:uncharacterized protein (TIGR03382 family)
MLALATLLIALWPPDLEVDPGLDPQAIYGGEPVEPGARPEVVAISTFLKTCTGTLVAPDLILTAAHCLDGHEAGAPVLVRFGDNVAAPTMTFNSTDWAAHEDFCLPSECGEDLHDIAWIRLPQPVDIQPVVPITDQAEFDEAMNPGAEVVFVGFGQTEDGELGVKREVTSTLTTFDESGREFRAGGDGKDTCLGDSGGPAFVRLPSGEVRLAGVLSRGGDCGEGGIYTIPVTELCWLRDSGGIDWVPDGCDSCNCVALHPNVPDDGCNCSSTKSFGTQLLTALALLGLALQAFRRRFNNG